MSTAARKQPWIYSAWPDGIFILSPPFLVLLFILLFPTLFHDGAEVSPVAWLLLILCIDVSHVYSTLYRTYLDREAYRIRKSLFLLVPLIVFVAGVLVYSIDALAFWRLAAYLAVFHFVRQQYGFLRIYSRNDGQPSWARWLDTVTIYTLTVYPISWWHLSGPRHFSWFVENDFIYIHAPWLLLPLKIVYLSIASGWLLKEIWFSLMRRQLNVPKIFLVAGTGLSWYVGIIAFDGDLVFTALNVVSHGIPYMALVWMHGNRKQQKLSVAELPAEKSFLSRIFSVKYLLVFAGILLVAAYLEEGLWDSLVWKDHPEYFSVFYFFPKPDDIFLSILVPLLTVPQFTHYVLDGFIWRIQKDKFNWKQVTLGETGKNDGSGVNARGTKP